MLKDSSIRFYGFCQGVILVVGTSGSNIVDQLRLYPFPSKLPFNLHYSSCIIPPFLGVGSPKLFITHYSILYVFVTHLRGIFSSGFDHQGHHAGLQKSAKCILSLLQTFCIGNEKSTFLWKMSI